MRIKENKQSKKRLKIQKSNRGYPRKEGSVKRLFPRTPISLSICTITSGDQYKTNNNTLNLVIGCSKLEIVEV